MVGLEFVDTGGVVVEFGHHHQEDLFEAVLVDGDGDDFVDVEEVDLVLHLEYYDRIKKLEKIE